MPSSARIFTQLWCLPSQSHSKRVFNTGTPVFAGTMNQSGVLEIRADKIGGQTGFGRIIEAVERAECSRARFADRASRPETIAAIFRSAVDLARSQPGFGPPVSFC